MDTAMIVYLLVVLVPLCGVLSIVMPRLVPRDEFFTVTVPPDEIDNPLLIALGHRYTASAAVAAIVETVLAFGLAGGFLSGVIDEGTFLGGYIALFLLMFPISFVLMLIVRKKAEAIKAKEGWRADVQQRAAFIAQGSGPKPLSLAWNLLYIPVLLLCVELVLFLYPMMPDQIPMQMNLAGEVTRYTAKTMPAAMLPVWIALFVAVCCIFGHWAMNRQKMPVDPSKPATSAYAFGAYRRATCIMLLVTGVLLGLVIGVTQPLVTVGFLPFAEGVIIIIVAVVVIVIGAIALSLVYGQNGSRLFKNAQAAEGLVRDDDRYWKMGVFYVNPEDPSVFVSKRFGVGVTMNFGSKAAWAIVIGFVVIVALFVLGMYALDE